MSESIFTSLTCLHYLDISAPTPPPSEPLTEDLPVTEKPSSLGVSEEEVQVRIAAIIADRQVAEQRLQQQHAQEKASLQQGIITALDHFTEERSTYFSRVESEIVHLALAIARRILQREAQLDPLLLAGLVRIALDNLQSGPAVRLRVPLLQVTSWQQHLGATASHRSVEVCVDDSLSPEECVLETSSGSAHLNYETQLKEVEHSFLNLLGQRPDLATRKSSLPATSPQQDDAA